MKNCFRIPRIIFPRGNYQNWATPPVDLLTKERCEEFLAFSAGRPSLLPCVVPDCDEALEDRLMIMRRSQYLYLREDHFERLNRGGVYVERETLAGQREGIVACLDLDSFSLSEPPVRFSTQTDNGLVSKRLSVRRKTLLEFPHTVLLYNDKHDKTIRKVGGDREELYDFPLPLGGGRIRGSFLPEEDAYHLLKGLMSRADFFTVADGNHSLSAAKKYWEEVKAVLPDDEKDIHSARFTLVEFVNAAQSSVSFTPIHRVVKEIETEAFCDYFKRHVKCKREGNVLYPILSGPESYFEANDTIATFLRQNYGTLERTLQGPKAYVDKEDCVFVAFPAATKEELFSSAKRGKKFPAKTFCLGGEKDARYSFEGLEISYD